MFLNRQQNYCDMSERSCFGVPVMYSSSNKYDNINNGAQFNQEIDTSTTLTSYWANSNERDGYERYSGASSNTNCLVKYNIGQDIIFVPNEFHSFIPDQSNNEENMNYPDFTSTYNSHKNSFKSSKIKRSRTTFTTQQIIALEEVFKKKPYVHREERIEMMKRLRISEKSIKVWFQNRRRLTDKRGNDYIAHSPLSDDTSDSITDRLTLIESHINQNTDGNGLVILDDEIMSSLVKVIDECLSQDVNIVNKNSLSPITNYNKVIYEPISPVSVSDDSEDSDKQTELISQNDFLGNTHHYYF